MNKSLNRVLIATSVLSLAACNESTSPTPLVDAAFSTSIAGFNDINSSFAGSDGPPEGFMPGMHRGPGLAGPGGPHGGMGRMGGPGGGVMGGGLDLAFAGGIPGGHGPHHGPFGENENLANCTFAAGTGNVTCTDTHDGLTITRVMTWKDAAGAAQEKPDSNTNSSRAQITVAGTITRRDGNTSTVSNSSDRTVTGLAVGATQRTVNGTSAGTENSSGTNREGKAFTATRTAGDTVVGIIVPIQDGRPTYPTAGTVTRSMKVTTTIDGATTTRERREVITYDGSANATIVITTDGASKTCSMPLPRGQLVCQ